MAQEGPHPESNVQFGEGGAGLFSDGKLYSQIKDPKFYARKVMHEFVRAGAPEEIMYVSKPHIGTFRLTGVVATMREEIIALGGEVRFESKVTDLLIDDGQLEGVVLANGETLHSRHVVLALGHSSRDTFRMLHRQGVFLEAKPFAIGFRIEHPQGLIDEARLGKYAGHPELGAADYKVVHHARNGRAVYSFCMCPGGTVVAATSEVGRVVTNGMSQYSRNERNANSGIVVGINPEQDFPAARWPAWSSRSAWNPVPTSWAAATTAPPANWWATSSVACRPASSATWSPPTSPACAWATLRLPCRTTPSRPSARHCRRSASRSVASTVPTRCSPASRPAPRPRCASPVTTRPCRASTSRACTRPAKAPATPAASSRRGGRHQGGRGTGQVDAVGQQPLSAVSMKLDDIKKLHQKKYRAEFGHFLVEGEHLLLELQKAAEHNPQLLRSFT